MIYKIRTKKYFRRYCKRCGDIYRPTGKFQELCDGCRIKTYIYRKNHKGNRK